MSDAGGLHVLVGPTGTRLWRFSYRYLGRQKTTALGVYPVVSLAGARGARDEAKRLLVQGSILPRPRRGRRGAKG